MRPCHQHLKVLMIVLVSVACLPACNDAMITALEAMCGWCARLGLCSPYLVQLCSEPSGVVAVTLARVPNCCLLLAARDSCAQGDIACCGISSATYDGTMLLCFCCCKSSGNSSSESALHLQMSSTAGWWPTMSAYSASSRYVRWASPACGTCLICLSGEELGRG